MVAGLTPGHETSGAKQPGPAKVPPEAGSSKAKSRACQEAWARSKASDVVVKAMKAEWKWSSSGGVAAVVAVEGGWCEVDK